MIGLFFEDINFAADGGLYAELLENRSFEAIKSKGSPRNYVLKEDNLYAWDSINQKEENLENYRKIEQEYINAYQVRKEKINNLYTEIKTIKALKV